MELTPQNIRDVRFRQAIRGYNPEDVDAFINDVVRGVEVMQQQLAEQTARVSEVGDARSYEASDVEESLRRTLVLAQRTADMAVREAQEEAARLLAEAAAERDAVLGEAAQMRGRMLADVEADVAAERERLIAEREALARDVAALHGYLEQERERLRIYFTDQLRRVSDGVPGLQPPPEMEAPPAAASADASDAAPVAAAPSFADGGDVDGPEGAQGEAEDDPFLAELRRAVNDTEPLGPRDEDAPEPAPEPRAGDSFDIFDDGDSGGGRFLRRKR